MFTELAAGFTATNHAINAVKGFVHLKTESERLTAVNEVLGQINEAQHQLTAAQQRYNELLDKNRDLEQQLRSIDEWKEQSARYELKKCGASTFVYRLKSEAVKDEVPHFACAKCFKEKKISILQWYGATSDVCQSCESVFQTAGVRP